MKNLRYICCQPAIPYYIWQVEVLINNFKKMGVNPNYIDIVCGIENGIIPDNWVKLMTHYNSVRFFFYNDTRTDKTYQPSIYFNLKHFFTVITLISFYALNGKASLKEFIDFSFSSNTVFFLIIENGSP